NKMMGDEVEGLDWRTFPQDGKRLPTKRTADYHTFLRAKPKALAVGAGSIAVLGKYLHRLSTAGGTAGLDFYGPLLELDGNKLAKDPVIPRAAAISPDGNWLYLTGYRRTHMYGRGWRFYDYHPLVTRMPLDGDEPPEVFLGTKDLKERGGGRDQFNCPTDVACDSRGRVYVTDMVNHRIKVFSPAGKLLKMIEAKYPVRLFVDRETDEIWVGSWPISNKFKHDKPKGWGFERTLAHFGSFDDPKLKARWPLPHGKGYKGSPHYTVRGLRHDGLDIAVAPAADPAKLWIAPVSSSLIQAGVRQHALDGRKWLHEQNFMEEAKKKIAFIRPPRHLKQRLYFDPARKNLYVGELHDPWPFHCTSMADVAKIDVETGRTVVDRLPFDAEDMAFGINGLAHLRTQNRMARFDPVTWREVPFDYGEKVKGLNTWGVRSRDVMAAITAAGSGVDGTFQAGGMGVSPKGHVFMTIANGKPPKDKRGTKNMHTADVAEYTPPIYPGRARPWEVHVWDKHGKVAYEDAVPGIGRPADIDMDRQDDLYVMVSGVGRVNGERYYHPISCTMFKMKPQTKILSRKGVLPLPPKLRPNRPPDVLDVDRAGDSWIKGKAQWVRGGVGFNGKRTGCLCASQSRFWLDYYGRSFLPEVDRYSVVVLDTNGNEMLRIGTYGNVDDGMPLIKEGGPPAPRSIGGDEVAIMHGQMLNGQSDRPAARGSLRPPSGT
ncbi:MAG: hypothetical protein R6V58_14045, partial [Planctomycetota bacterium]